MALVKWAKGIEFVSGLLSKRPKKGEMHSDHENALLATHRVAETTNPDCTRLYVRKNDVYERSTPVGADEVQNRIRFAAVAAAVAARAKDLTKITQDMAAFQAQKETGYKTMKSYLWSLEKAAYDAEHQG